MIEVLVGMIASGKSTYAGQRARDGALVVNDDAIVAAIHGGNYDLYSKRLKHIYKGIENYIVSSGAGAGLDIIIDRGVNVRRNSRMRWISLARSLDVPCFAVEFQKCMPIDHASARFAHDARGHDLDYWIKVATSHDLGYSKPSLDEGFDSICAPNWRD